MIHIKDDLYLDSNSHNVMLVREKLIETGKNKGQTRMVPFAFYPTVDTALSDVINICERESLPDTLLSLVRGRHELVEHLGKFITDNFKEKK